MNTTRNSLILILGILLVVSSCYPKKQEDGATDEETPMSETNTAGQEITEEQKMGEENYYEYTFLEFAEQKDYLKTFADALDASGLMDSINTETSYTLFAPANAAFDELPNGTLAELLLPENKDDLISILKYHIYPAGALRYTEITEGMTVTTLSGEELLFNIKESGMVINTEAKVLDADIETKNGIVHVINDVMFPPDL